MLVPVRRWQVGFLYEVVGWDEAPHLWTEVEIHLPDHHWEVSFACGLGRREGARLTIGTRPGVHPGVVSWGAKPPRRLLRDLVSVVCVQLSWLGWENHETVMTSWAAHDRELYVEEKNARRKEIHCHEVSSRPNKWENAHPGSRNHGASWKGL